MTGMWSQADWAPIALTLQLALVTTVILLVVGTPLAWWLARSASRIRPVIEAVVALPIVLPPTVLGFYLIVLLGPHGWVGRPWEAWGGARLVFSFPGMVIGSVLYSLPFAVQPLTQAFKALGERPLEVAASLRAAPWDRFLSVVLPLARPGFLSATVLAFAHTVGEFGVVLMVGGNIPGRTQVVSTAIYDHVEMMEYGQAYWLSAGMVAFAFLALLALYVLNGRSGVRA
jgi:molybdate transport system permease protein